MKLSELLNPNTPPTQDPTPDTPEGGNNTPPGNEGGNDQQDPPAVEPVIDPNVPPVTPPAGVEGNEPEGEEEEEQEPDFYATLDALYGEDVNGQVDYGDVDPLSAEGVFRREQYLANKAVSSYQTSLQTTDPRAYAYMLHRQNGGSDESFFESKSFILPSEDVIKTDPDVQKEVYRQILINRGNSVKQADALVKIAIEDGELSKEALEAFKAMKEDETKEFQQAQHLSEQKRIRETSDIKGFGDLINKSIETNDGLGFSIPQADKDKFSNFLREKIHYDNGEFYTVQKVDQQNLNKVIEAELFSYFGGNLEKLVTRRATTVAARRTINRAAKDNTTSKGTGTQTSGIMTLGSILN